MELCPAILVRVRCKKVLATAVAAVLSAGLTGCSTSYDAWFANPCSYPVVVRTLYVERGTDASRASDEVIATASLRPEAVTKVEEAFQDANGFTWFVAVEGGPLLRVSKKEMPKWFVALPASVCQ